jgi:hypothetical protein
MYQNCTHVVKRVIIRIAEAATQIPVDVTPVPPIGLRIAY